MTKPDGDYHAFKVSELRKLARSLPHFPLTGRQISKTTKDELLTLLDDIFKNMT